MSVTAAAPVPPGLRPPAALRAIAVVLVLLPLGLKLFFPGALESVLLWVDLVGTVAAVVALWRPVTGALLCLIPMMSALSLGEYALWLAPLMLSAFVALAGPRRAAGIGVPAGLALAIVFGHLQTFWPHQTSLAWLGLLLLAAAAGIATRGFAVRRIRQAARLRKLERSVAEIRLRERAVLADELLSLVAGSLGESEAVLERVTAQTEHCQIEALQEVSGLMRAALTRLRQLILTLRPVESRSGSWAQLLERCEETLTMYGHGVELEAGDGLPPGPVPPAAVQVAHLLTELAVVHGEPGAACRLAARWVGPPGEGVEFTLTIRLARTDPERILALTRVRLQAIGATLIGERRQPDRIQVVIPLAGPAAERGRSWWARTTLRDRLRPLGWLTGAAVLLAAVWGWNGGSWEVVNLLLVGLALVLLPLSYRWSLVLLSVSLLAGGTLLVTIGSNGSWILALVVLCALVSARSWTWFLVTALLLTAASGLLVAPQGEIPDAWMVLWGCLWGGLIGAGWRYFQRLSLDQAAEFESLREQQIQARADERHQLAGELHDLVAHQLALISLRASSEPQVEGAAGGSTPLATVRLLRESIEQASADLQSVVATLRGGRASPQVGDAEDVGGTVDQVVATLRRAGLRTKLLLSGRLDRCDSTAARTLNRLLREGSTNILRYADRQAECSLRLVVTAATVELTLTNRCCQAKRRDPHSTGNGLTGLQERARLTGAEFRAGPRDQEWVLEAIVPLDAVVPTETAGPPPQAPGWAGWTITPSWVRGGVDRYPRKDSATSGNGATVGR